LNSYAFSAIALGLTLEVVAAAIYLWGQITGRKMRVHPVTWIGLTAVMGAGTSSSFASGGGLGAWVFLVMTIGTGLVAAVSVYHLLKDRKRVYDPTRLDWMLLVFGMALLVLRVVALKPLPSAIAAIVGDSCFLWPTLKKLWEEPGSEGSHGKWSWTLTTVSAVLGTCVLESYQLASWLYPVYVAISTGLLAAACWGFTPGKSQYYAAQRWRQAHIKARVSRV
jgi:hypothetical protein